MSNILRRPIKYSYYSATIILIVVNILVFLFSFVDRQHFLVYLYLIPGYVLQAGWWWQIVTYMFVHANWSHIFFNMLALFLFGIQLEQRMGSTEFLLYYFVCGIGAGHRHGILQQRHGPGNDSRRGRLGGDLRAAAGVRRLLPRRADLHLRHSPHARPGGRGAYAGIEIVSQFFGGNSGVAHLTHLAGLLFAYLYLLVRFGINPITVFFRRR